MFVFDMTLVLKIIMGYFALNQISSIRLLFCNNISFLLGAVCSISNTGNSFLKDSFRRAATLQVQNMLCCWKPCLTHKTS